MLLSLLSSLAVFVSAEAAAGNTMVAFTEKGSAGWEQYDWNSITHLAFWSMPPDATKAKAAQHGVKLFQNNNANLGDKDWTDSGKVDAAVAQIKQQVTSLQLDGTFFDYEGNGLSDAQKNAYTAYVRKVRDAIAPKEVFVCVGGRPSYELRNYDYAGLADASSFLFIMGYDMHFYFDYTCVTKGTCSPAEAPLADLKSGITDYKKLVPSNKLVLGLPWYGQRYTQVLGLLYSQGQADVKEFWPILYGDLNGRKKSRTFYNNDKDYAVKLMCENQCLDGDKKGGVIWYDDEESLPAKYQLAKDNGLLGIGIWTVAKLDYSGQYDKYVQRFWGAVAAWKASVAPGAVANMSNFV